MITRSTSAYESRVHANAANTTTKAAKSRRRSWPPLIRIHRAVATQSREIDSDSVLMNTFQSSTGGLTARSSNDANANVRATGWRILTATVRARNSHETAAIALCTSTITRRLRRHTFASRGNRNGAPLGVARNFRLQIGAFADLALARTQLAAYAEKAMDVLGQAQRIVVPFQSVDGHTLFRARFGPFAEREARQICSRLTERGQTCFAAISSR